MRIIELFGGIGACSKAIKRLNIPLEIVDYVENDKYAVQTKQIIKIDEFKSLIKERKN